MAEEIVNKVAESGILTIDLEALVPNYKLREIDFKDLLWQGLALREADLRTWLKTNDFSDFEDAVVGIHCTADAIIPSWAFMLVTSKLTGIARFVTQGNAELAEVAYVSSLIRSLDRKNYENLRVVIKGCSDRKLPPEAFVALTAQLQPVVKTLMFGEPCSTVPVYKQPRKG